MPHTVYSNTDTVAFYSTITSLEVDFKSEREKERGQVSENLPEREFPQRVKERQGTHTYQNIRGLIVTLTLTPSLETFSVSNQTSKTLFPLSSPSL